MAPPDCRHGRASGRKRSKLRPGQSDARKSDSARVDRPRGSELGRGQTNSEVRLPGTCPIRHGRKAHQPPYPPSWVGCGLDFLARHKNAPGRYPPCRSSSIHLSRSRTSLDWWASSTTLISCWPNSQRSPTGTRVPSRSPGGPACGIEWRVPGSRATRGGPPLACTHVRRTALSSAARPTDPCPGIEGSPRMDLSQGGRVAHASIRGRPAALDPTGPSRALRGWC